MAVLTAILTTVALLIAVLLALAVIFVLGMRTKWPPVLNVVRGLSRAVFNPRQMKTAGTPGAYASVIRHHGRATGAPFETPVVALPTENGFVIALPYGTHSNWVKNVLKDESATIRHEGHTYRLDQPELISSMDVADVFSPADQRVQRWFGVDQCLRFHRAESPSRSVSS